MKILSKIILILFVIGLIPAQLLKAEELDINNVDKTDKKESKYSITIDKNTIDKGYTVSCFADKIKLSLTPGILASATPVEVQVLDEKMDIPWQLDRISPIYQFEFANKLAYDNRKPYYIQMSYENEADKYKKLYFYDKTIAKWRPLPTKDFPKEKFVRSLIHLPFARIAVFAFPNTLTNGRASWYSYKNGLFAASPDFPKGSRLRVYNNDNGKFVDVEVNDFGPNRVIHPDRPIDLDKVAFSKIAALSEGVINVTIEPLLILKDNGDNESGLSDSGLGSIPSTKLRAALVLDSTTENQIYAKNINKVLPLASLTKIVAVHTFLGEKSDLGKIVKYSNQDAELNYQYCKPWESAKLSVPDGEEMTVKDLIYVSLVGSANNTVETLVRVSGLSRVAFVNKMNTNVKEWGASSTKFVEPTGLSPENVTTALDYAIITKEVFKNEIVKKASIALEYNFKTITQKIDKTIKNTDPIIKNNKYTIIGSKTGYLDEALYCLMTIVDVGNNKSIIVVSLGAETRSASLLETEKLIQYGIRKSNL